MSMATTENSTNTQDVGDVIALSPSKLQDLGKSAVPDARPTTNLADDVAALIESGVTRGAKCAVGLLLESLSEEDARKVMFLLDETRVVSGEVSQLLRRHGHPVSVNVIQRHRSRLRGSGCRCPR